ncbi:hypothetical protein [Christiangramia sabulilitoris]|uniref:Uncharacterized protein n=1 Tax=Christiangramia sabulilitoris TaxID=2583991 RepID=A0A550I6R8_9FLAO|nr:hypothetical protein [Christiangramia sabulilitoris]TRO66508.1 hypothetical protein FGM01_01100 [Christiangramia sabulilitoris]
MEKGKKTNADNLKTDSEETTYNPEVTKEDKQALNEKGRSMNKGQDRALDREREVDFTASELDIPGSNDARPTKEGEIPDEQNLQYNDRGSRPEHKKKPTIQIPTKEYN